MKIINASNPTHSFTFMVRSHTAAGGYVLELRNEEKKTVEDIALTSVYDEDKGELTVQFPLEALNNTWYSAKIYTSNLLTADTTVITADTTLITADATGSGKLNQVYRGMVFATTQTDMPKFEMMKDIVTVPDEEQITFITPS